MTPALSNDAARRRTRSARLAPALALAIAAALPPGAAAAALKASFTGADGAPLADAVVLLEPASGKVAVKPMAEVDIAQAKRQFNPRVTVITTGTRVNFPNFDTVRHHVYSFSPIKTFELKLYSGVPGMPVLFDKPGIAVLGCNIHDSMAAWVVVADTPWAARSGANGLARIEGVPAGSYRLRVWHPGLSANAELPPVAMTIGSTDAEYSAHLPVQPLP